MERRGTLSGAQIDDAQGAALKMHTRTRTHIRAGGVPEARYRGFLVVSLGVILGCLGEFLGITGDSWLRSVQRAIGCVGTAVGFV